MPTIAVFFGIAIRMYFDDHAPPHFHAHYQQDMALVRIDTLEVIGGPLPARALALVLEWAELHRAELHEDWRRAVAHEPLDPIAPLE